MQNNKNKAKDIKKDSVDQTSDLSNESPINNIVGDEFVNDININHSDSYHENLPSNINIFSHIKSEILKLKDEKVKKNIISFIEKLKAILSLQRNNIIINDIHLRPIALNENDDGSVIIEWLFKEYRVGFSIEADFNKSSWYVISAMKNNENYHSGLLCSINLDEFFQKILENVVSIS